MSNLKALGRTLEVLEIPFSQDGEYLRTFCALPHIKASTRPSGSFNIKTGRYHCFNCNVGAKGLDDFLLILEMDTRLQMKKHPDQSQVYKTKLALVAKAQKALNDIQATSVSTTA